MSSQTSVVRTEECIVIANSEGKYVKTKYWPVGKEGKVIPLQARCGPEGG